MKRPRIPAALPHVASFECTCGNIHHAPDARLPVGWSQRGSKVWCADCTRAGIAARTVKPRRPSPDKLRLRSQVLALLKEGAALMPPGSAKRVNWVSRVNALIDDQKSAA
ncbi:hypothetical protein HGI47_18360 [Novosphingobium sp. ERN07]|uniref:hypothetical protein n=1 Tax=Novosphingobium sp. ERN07 TaxID=2726187 RepID=UPI00145753A4|nr:hypothetical protein [Novosphingobium sp. ERN07]NLR72842.1 hypothetical protein [Novosphingobium sp. ERN07]